MRGQPGDVDERSHALTLRESHNERVTQAVTCAELTKRYPDGTLALAGIALRPPLLLLEIAAVALVAGHRSGRRDVVLAA